MVIPPPNITGILHMGHALNNTLQDIVARYKRMRGYEVLWIAGTDHAGIATQNVVEKMLRKQNLDRQQLGREKFLEKVWQWREKYGHTIVEQLKRLGCSCDWDRLRFTMDEGLSRAVREVFVRLYNKGLIYKGHRIINWCPRCRTALSDEEVTHKELPGHLWHIKYSIEGSDGHVVIATTRPETMLGDTAVGFHPTDERYAHARGKTLLLPILGRKLRVIEDESIDPAFGTGALKITPAHDPADFELGQKHGLDFINILNEDGTLNQNAGPYAGLDRFQARSQVLKELEDRRLLLETKEHRHSVGHCYRCDTIIEPYCSDQWFVKMKPLAKPAIKAVKTKEIRFYPARWSKVYLDWMMNIKDWCISRQIWWGHRIPVWTCGDCEDKHSKPTVIVAIETPKKCTSCGSTNLTQEEDVLDTWFSSWLWPFSTLGWPNQTAELKKFYPTTTLVTGYEIIFFWVSRMVMSGYEFMGKKPFSDIYIHGIVRDATGAKMSKSLGNIVDPIEIIDEFGADALRYSIISITGEGQDVYAAKERFEIGRNFANKMWNASRFALLNMDIQKARKRPDAAEFTPVDRWILSRLQRLIKDVTDALEGYRYNEATSALYEFFWHEFCDWYLELIKPRMESPASQWVLREILESSMKLFHPIMPFITEEIWELMHPGKAKDTLMVSQWPTANPKWIDKKAEEEIQILILQVQAIRNVRSTWQLSPKDLLTVYVKTASKKHTELYKKYSDDIMHLAKVGSLKYGASITRPQQSVIASVGRIESYVVLSGLVDIEFETGRIQQALTEVEGMIKGVEAKLANESFTSKAPKDVVDGVRNRHKELEDRKVRLQENLKVLTLTSF